MKSVSQRPKSAQVALLGQQRIEFAQRFLRLERRGLNKFAQGFRDFPERPWLLSPQLRKQQILHVDAPQLLHFEVARADALRMNPESHQRLRNAVDFVLQRQPPP